MNVRLTPSEVRGTVTAPPSKSMAHRAILCAALAPGRSRVDNLAFSQDILATLNAVRALGARVETGDSWAVIDGPQRIAAQDGVCVDCAESGSTLRFLIPVFAQTGADVRFTGRGRLLERPQGVYEALFAEKGVAFTHTPAEVRVRGPLPAGEYEVDGGVSSQFITGLLLALPLCGAPCRVTVRPPFESRSYVGLTLRAMADFGVHIEENGNTYCINGEEKYVPANYAVEGDYSQAAFFAVLGAVCGGVTVRGLREDSLQGDRVILDILARCGASFTREGGAVRFEKSRLHGARIDIADCPDLGPILMVLGLFCEGETVLENAARLRVKESDRIAAMEAEIRKLGGQITSDENTVTVRASRLHAPDAPLDSHNDHRVVMAMAVAALGAGVPAVIENAQAVAKSYPDFFDVLRSIGGKAEEHG